MLLGPTVVTVEVRIAPLHTMYPAVAWVALLTEEVIWGVPLYYPSWLKVLKERKAALITDIEAAHGIPQLDRDQRGHPEALAKGVQYQQGNIARAAQNRQNRAKSTVISRQGSRSLARLRDEMEEMRRLEAMGTYTDDDINRLARG
nr:hypothetical protein [Tanacetum cinerariifolium]